MEFSLSAPSQYPPVRTTIPRLALRKWQNKKRKKRGKTTFLDWRGFGSCLTHSENILWLLSFQSFQFLVFNFFFFYIFLNKKTSVCSKTPWRSSVLRVLICKAHVRLHFSLQCNLCSWSGHTVNELSASVRQSVKCLIQGCSLVAVWFFCIYCWPQECVKGKLDSSGKFPVVLWWEQEGSACATPQQTVLKTSFYFSARQGDTLN